MTIEKLERVLRRVRQDNPNKSIVSNNEIRKAVDSEIGTDPRTYKVNRRALIRLGWIRYHTSKRVVLTNKDLTDT